MDRGEYAPVVAAVQDGGSSVVPFPSREER
jgi:hypothetical protein